jgi:drug/metabolite transporter (DMT)-like permease
VVSSDALAENPVILTTLAGTLLTFVQFFFVAVVGYAAQFDKTRPPFFVKPNKVPISRWLVNIVLFFTINMLNNHAFSYDISVPVHIILRSGGSISTIAVGYLYGKRYSRIQVTSVVLITTGIILAAWSDAQTKVSARSKKGIVARTDIIARRDSLQMIQGRHSVPASLSCWWPRFYRL